MIRLLFLRRASKFDAGYSFYQLRPWVEATLAGAVVSAIFLGMVVALVAFR